MFPDRAPQLPVSTALKITLLAAVLLAAGCKKQENSSRGTLAVTDFRGRELRFEKPVERAVCLIVSSLSGIFMLRANDRLVAIPGSIYAFNADPVYALLDERISLKTLPIAGDWDFVTIEQVAALLPDIVIIWASQTESIENMERLGIRVYGVAINRIEDIYKEIRDFGVLFDRDARADSLIVYAKATIGAVQNRAAKALGKKRVYFMWAQGIQHTSGTNSTVHDCITAAGGVNVCTAAREHAVINSETIMSRNPEVIVMAYNTRIDPADIYRDRRFEGISAVRDSCVFEFPTPHDYSLWTLKICFAVTTIAKWTYPHLFELLDLKNEQTAVMQFLYGSGKAGTW